ncbi:MAG: hypothetical protein IT176_09165 [Acidobacteria bacterium]|nr:hypothetical protein [Acidobacteriota bacterium]
MNRTLIVLAASLALLDPGSLGAQLPPQAPRALVQAAPHLTAQRFLLGLAEAGISGGVYLSADQEEPFGEAPRLHDDDGSVQIDVSVAAFADGHSDWHVANDGGVVNLFAGGLSGPSRVIGDVACDEVSFDNALLAVVQAIYPTRVPAGIVGSMSGAPRPLTQRMTLALHNVTMIEALNALVAQVPGSTWLLVRHDEGAEPYDQLRIRTPNGVVHHVGFPLAPAISAIGR